MALILNTQPSPFGFVVGERGFHGHMSSIGNMFGLKMENEASALGLRA